VIKVAVIGFFRLSLWLICKLTFFLAAGSPFLPRNVIWYDPLTFLRYGIDITLSETVSLVMIVKLFDALNFSVYLVVAFNISHVKATSILRRFGGT
jgi:hypothetical protein